MKTELNKLIAGKSIDEVSLFRAINQIFQVNYNSTLIEETHQNYVLFNYSSFSTPMQIRREISDLWIIAYSPNKKEARMSFLQAKFHKKIFKSVPAFKFSGEYFQYKLLSTRPKIVNASKFNFPTDILSFSHFDSLGTFGVFYYDSQGNLDLAYTVASELICKNGATKNQQTVRQLTFPKMSNVLYSIKSYNSKDYELCTTLYLDIFTLGILNLKVGAPIHNNKNIQIFLSQFFRPLRTNPVVEDFLNFLRDFDSVSSDVISNSDGNSPRILLINVDGKN